MNFNSLRKEITSNNASVKELVNDISLTNSLTEALLLVISFLKELKFIS